MSQDNSYGQILRSSAIIGGAQGMNYLVGLVRVKIIAVLLGPAGLGLISLLTSATALIGTLTGLGIGSSGVREVAKAYAEDDRELAARTVHILRRMCWITGLTGWLLTATLSYPISRWIFGNTEHALAVALLGSTLLLGTLTGGQTALLQGVRRIGDLARINVYSMLINTAVAIGLYAWLREAGIVPVLITTAATSLVVALWFARQVDIPHVALDWPATLHGARSLLGLGTALMWSGLLTAGLDMATRSLIAREYGMEATGYYQAAWALSGIFAGFIVSAMGMDFYPRLTAVIEDPDQARRVVNEQTEIGILLALPGLLATLALAPLIVRLLYSEHFAPAAQLLPWFLLGVFGRVISWPLGFIILAKGAARWFVASETTFVGLQLALVVWSVPLHGTVGAAYAFAATYLAYTIAVLFIGRALIAFRWSNRVVRLVVASAAVLSVATAFSLFASPLISMAVGCGLAIFSAVIGLRGLAARLGSQHGFVRAVAGVPGGRTLLNINRAT